MSSNESETHAESRVKHPGNMLMQQPLWNAAKGGDDQLPNFYHAVLTFERCSVGLNVTTTTTKKVVNFWGTKCTTRPPEKILATRMRKGPPRVRLTLVWGPRMVNLAHVYHHATMWTVWNVYLMLCCTERERARLTPLLHVQVAVCRRQCVQCEYAWYSTLPGQKNANVFAYHTCIPPSRREPVGSGKSVMGRTGTPFPTSNLWLKAFPLLRLL